MSTNGRKIIERLKIIHVKIGYKVNIYKNFKEIKCK